MGFDTEDNRLRVCLEDTLGNVLPDEWRSLADLQIGLQVFEGLVRYDADMNIVAGLARAWRYEPLEKTWWFELQEGRRFHDDAEVTPEAIVWNFRNRLQTHPELAPLIRSATPVGNAVRITLNQHFAPFPDRLASPAAVIVSPATRHAGSGPFRFSGFSDPVPGQNVVLVRHSSDDESGRLARPVHIEFSTAGDGVQMWKRLVDDRVDVVYECPYQVLLDPNGHDEIQVSSCRSLSTNFLLFNQTAGVFKNRDCRRYVHAGIDKQALIARGNLGVGDVAFSPVSPANRLIGAWKPARSPEATRRPKELHSFEILANQGFTKVWLDTLKAQLAENDLTCTITEVPFPQLMARLRFARFDAVLTGFQGSPDPDQILFDCFHSRGKANFGGMADPHYDQLIGRARCTMNESDRRELYRLALETLTENCPAVFYRHGLSIVATRNHVSNIQPFPDNCLRLADLELMQRTVR